MNRTQPNINLPPSQEVGYNRNGFDFLLFFALFYFYTAIVSFSFFFIIVLHNSIFVSRNNYDE